LQSDAAKKKKTDEPTEDVVPEEDKVLCCKRNPESVYNSVHWKVVLLFLQDNLTIA